MIDTVETRRRVLLTRQETEPEHEIWAYLYDHQLSYQGQTVAPMKRVTRQETEREFIICRLYGNGNDWELPIGLVWYDGETTNSIDLEQPGWLDKLLSLFHWCRKHKRWLIFIDGQKYAFPLLLRLAPQLLAHGYTSLTPIASGKSIKCLTLRRGRHSVKLCDLETMTGIAQCELERSFWAAPCASELELFHKAVWSFQQFTLLFFGVALRVTLPSAAMQAARRHLPADTWLWKPPSLLVAMCRAGGGFRGGYIYARPYKGMACKSDVNKLYASALRSPLPLRCMAGHYDGRPGVFLCKLTGDGRMPAYVSVWRGAKEGFVRQYVQNINDGLFEYYAGGIWTVLPTNEIEGLRLLGYTVEPRYGFIWTRTFDMAGYVDVIEEVTKQFPRGTAQHSVAKLFGNAIWGKWAENPVQVEARYAESRPTDGIWYTMLDSERNESPNVWLRKKVAFKSHQQVHLAACVTSEARNTLYRGLDAADRAGARILYSDTDSIITDGDLTGWLDYGERIGQWRLEGTDENSIITQYMGGYVFGERSAFRGRRLTRQQVEIAINADGDVRIGKYRQHVKRIAE